MRLSGKLIVGTVSILVVMFTGTLFINSRLAKRYYLYQQRNEVGEIGESLRQAVKNGAAPQDAIDMIEEKEKVLIVRSENTEDQEALGSELREAFRQKGLGFQKFWMWEQDYDTVMEKGSKFRLYSQDKLNYSILVQYLSLGSDLYAVAAIVPNAEGLIRIINHFGFALYSAAMILSVWLIVILVRHITNPLTEIQAFTRKLSSGRYEPLTVRTGDELEEVAESLNKMGYEIEQYQLTLKQLLSDVAHDLKTPVSLMGVYASGIRDGLDDGTFLDTIIRQNDRMARIVERLLFLSRVEQAEYSGTKVRLDQLLRSCIDEQRLFFEQRELALRLQIEPGLEIVGNPEWIAEVFSNFLSNAAKYALSGSVEISLFQKEKSVYFSISNEADGDHLDTDRIWQPFYVGEESRNEALSGTGLGLSIVKKIAERCGYAVKCRREGSRIVFEVLFVSGV